MWLLFYFVLGTIIGSFLHVVISRLRTGEGFIWSRSHCPSCEHALSGLDLVPLLSWFWLRGRCRYCAKRIDLSYFLVEAVTGLLFVLSGLAFGADLPRLLLAWFVLAVLVVVFVYDLRYMLIPSKVVVPVAVVAFVGGLFLGEPITSLVGGVVVTAGFFWLQRILSGGRWIGGGDVKLGLLMGASLGLSGSLVALFLAYVGGAAVGLALLATRQKSWRGELPFGTFLSVATAISLLYGGQIAAWYLGLVSG